MRELFIYYRLQFSDAVQAAAWQVQVLAMQRGLQIRHPGLQTRLLRRPAGEPVDGWHTWMETYACPQTPGGVHTALQDEIEAAAQSLAGPSPAAIRHVEEFTSCAS